MALTKNDIVAKVNDLGFTKKKSIETVESLLEIIKGTLEGGNDVLVSGFGKFCVKEKQEAAGQKSGHRFRPDPAGAQGGHL
jgi:integration host factor subunit alpha